MGVKYDTELPESFYPDATEAQRRLQGTVVMYNGEGYYVNEIRQRTSSSPIVARIRQLTGSDHIDVPIKDKGFNNFAAFPLGFCNCFNPSEGRPTHECTYVSRIPSRAIPQGLSNRNVSVSSYGGRGPSFERMRDTIGFAEMLRGEYPTYEEAYSKLLPSTSIAIDREHALRMSAEGFVGLYYKGMEKSNLVAIATSTRLLVPQLKRHFKRSLLNNPFLPNIVEVLE